MATLNYRASGSNRDGGSWDNTTLLRVWQKGRLIPNFDSSIWRWDSYGSVIRWDRYGNTSSEHGWEVDHIRPIAANGSDDLKNLQPLQWQNNRQKGDTY
jgi:hypothetical protein